MTIYPKICVENRAMFLKEIVKYNTNILRNNALITLLPHSKAEIPPTLNL